MAATLNCRPVAAVIHIEGELRKILMKKLWPDDKFSTPQYIDKTWEQFIEGLVSANVKGAAELRDELLKYDRLMFDLEQ